MKSSLSLLLSALAASFCAWAFWHFSDEHAVEIFSMLAIVTLSIDNIRLRRKLREGNQEFNSSEGK